MEQAYSHAVCVLSVNLVLLLLQYPIYHVNFSSFNLKDRILCAAPTSVKWYNLELVDVYKKT